MFETRGPDPRPSNHGGHTPSTPPPHPPLGEALRSRFDWYELTADGLDDGRIATTLAVVLGAQVVPAKGRNGYAQAQAVQRGDDVLAVVYGRSARLGEVHVTVTGASCDEVVPILRRLWPEHRVSRADASVDFVADFEQLDSLVLAFAEDRRLSFRLVTNSDGGATRYVGAPSSEVSARFYKKSEQLLALHPDRAGSIPAGIVRAEVQVRPGKRAAKDAVASMEPDDLWGMGGWARDIAFELLAIDPQRTSTHFRRPSDWSRALFFLGSQYSPSVGRRIAEVGAEVARREVLVALGLS